MKEETYNDDINHTPGEPTGQYSVGVQAWCSARSRFLAQFGERMPALEEVFVEFSEPNFGWIDMSVYLGGKLCYTQSLSDVFDPFPEFKRWLERMSSDDGHIMSEFCCDYEGAYCYIVFESLLPVADGDIDDTGILYITDTGSKQTVCAYCNRQQLVRAFYLAILHWHRISSTIIGMWIDVDVEGRWQYYNRALRSSMVESYITGHAPSRSERFVKANIGERLHMWAEWGDALFWAEPKGCSGNADLVHTETHGDISFKESLPELRAWYDDFDCNGLNAGFDRVSWINQGRKVAARVRELLPDDIELFFDWEEFPATKRTLKDYDNVETTCELPMIVFNERLRRRFYPDRDVRRMIYFSANGGVPQFCFNLFGRRFTLAPAKLMKILTGPDGRFTANSTDKELETCEVYYSETTDQVVWLASMPGLDQQETLRFSIRKRDYLNACHEAFDEACKWLKAQHKPEEELATYLMQMDAVRAMHTPLYRLFFSDVKVAEFAFNCENGWCDLRIHISVAGRMLSSYMSDWSTDLECLRMRLEAAAMHSDMAEELRFYFDGSPVIISFRAASVLDSTERVAEGTAFHWHDGLVFVTVEPDSFTRQPVLFGLCERKQVLRQIYEGLLRTAIFSQDWSEHGLWDDLTNLQFYNKIKSPILEAEIQGINRSYNNNVPTYGRVRVKHLLLICPDIDEVARSEDHLCHMWFDDDDIVEVAFDDIERRYTVPGFEAWYNRYLAATDFANTATDPGFDYTAWHNEGIRLAKMLRRQLDESIDLWYGYPYEDYQKRNAPPLLIYNDVVAAN